VVAKMLSGAGVKGSFVQLHATSRWMFKCLPPALTAKTIDFLQQEKKTTVVLTAAPNETEMSYVKSVTALCATPPVDFSGKLTLSQTASLSRRAKLFFGVDSAPMHMAASQNTPCIAVFGPSGAFNWGPWDNRQKESGYTKKNGIQRMGMHTVIQAERECIPCGRDGCDGSKKSDCLEKMDIKSVVNELQLHFN
jgi:heptosyltransferase III